MSVLMTICGGERMAWRLNALGISMTLLVLAIAAGRPDLVALHLSLSVLHALHIQGAGTAATVAAMA